jgi:uncharacterized protein YacL
MLLRIVFVVFLGLVAYFGNKYNLNLKIYLFSGSLAFGALLERFILIRLPFYRFLAFLITATLSLVMISLLANALGVSYKVLIPVHATNVSFQIGALFSLYLACYYGKTSTLWKASGDAGGVDEASAILIDTSALIDGRVFDISKAGFLTNNLVIPSFVVRELQLIADSPVHEKRKKGRRGLDILKALKANSDLSVTISPVDYIDEQGVDNKLLRLAKDLKARIVTNDFNLLKVAEVEGVKVININQIATLLKPAHTTGDTLKVNIVKKGNNRRQGVAYLEDDTMVVVEDGEKYIGTTQTVIATTFLQSETGKLLFARIA